MAEVTLAERGATSTESVEEGDLLLPLPGNWSATLRLADPDQPAWLGKAVTLDWMGQPFQGAVDAEAVAEGKSTLFVVGGAGKLLAEVPSKHYQNASGQLILQEACAAAGEQYTGARLPQPAQFSQFPRRRGPLADALDDLARSLGLLWGVLPSGEVWLGQPPWDAAPEFDADHLEDDGVYQTRIYEIRAFGPLPGQTLDGRRLGCCRYTARDKQGTRLQVWFTVDGSSLDGDPVRGGLRDLIRETVPLVWLGKYPGQVRAVRSNGTWDVQLDEKRMPPLVGVRPRVFAPGAKVVPPAGSRVEVSFEQADPRYPVAELFEGGDAQKALIIDGDEVDVGSLTLTVSGGGGSPAALAWSYTNGLGATSAGSSGQPISLKGKAKKSQTKVYL